MTPSDPIFDMASMYDLVVDTAQGRSNGGAALVVAIVEHSVKCNCSSPMS